LYASHKHRWPSKERRMAKIERETREQYDDVTEEETELVPAALLFLLAFKRDSKALRRFLSALP
jgi:hypothetical protein